MSRITVNHVSDGLHPSEVVVTIHTADGLEEEVALDRQLVLSDSTIETYPVGSLDGRVLVELPRETARGHWRVWISADAIKRDLVSA